MALDKKADHDLSTEQYAAIASFRYELRRFLAFSESAAASVGLPPQQHQALLVIAGNVGPHKPTVGTVADQLLIAPHTAAELASRMTEAALITKTPATHDRRRVELSTTPKADALLHRLTAAHLEELKTLEPALTKALGRLSRARPLQSSLPSHLDANAETQTPRVPGDKVSSAPGLPAPRSRR